MKKLKTNYKIGGIILLIALIALVFPTQTKANLQSRPGVTSLTNKTASEFFLLCRQMETAEGPLGLSATITDEEDVVKETSALNGIDVHMIKNTEYGTAAMLSASAYGDCPTGSSSSASTTGNKSGIMQMADHGEFVSGTYNSYYSYNKKIYNADAKYRDLYESDDMQIAYKPGDATYETQKWRGAPAYFVKPSDPQFTRSGGGVFGFNYTTGYEVYGYGSRAAMVCGNGF